MPTTNEILYDEVRRLRTECEYLRALAKSETDEANKWNQRACETQRERDSARYEVSMLLDERNRATPERDQARSQLADLTDRFEEVKRQRDQAEQERDAALKQAEVQSKDAIAWNRRCCEMMAERDDARRDVAQARGEVKRLTEIVQKQQVLVRRAEDDATRDRNARAVIFRERAAAEAKVADIGWRKNKLIAAIEKRGFVVRWQRDGTPEVLTTAEAAERDKPKPKTSFYDYMFVLTSQALRDMERSLIFGYPNKPGSLFSFTNVGPPPAAPAISKPPVGAPIPAPTAQDYYRAATKAVYGYPVDPQTNFWKRA